MALKDLTGTEFAKGDKVAVGTGITVTPLLGSRVVFSVTGQSKTAAEQLIFLTKIQRTIV